MKARDLMMTAASAGELRAFDAIYGRLVTLHGHRFATEAALSAVLVEANPYGATTKERILELKRRPQLWA
jgi:hypothetical protein